MFVAISTSGNSPNVLLAIEAAQRAISSPLLEDATINGARGVLINVTGGPDMSLHEVSEASIIVQEAADQGANIIFGTVIDETMGDSIKITVIATGFHQPGADVRPQDLQSRPQLEAEMPRMEMPQQVELPDPVPVPPDHADQPFLRRNPSASAVKVAQDESEFGPHYKGLRDDLDVPTFIRKNMD